MTPRSDLPNAHGHQSMRARHPFTNPRICFAYDLWLSFAIAVALFGRCDLGTEVRECA